MGVFLENAYQRSSNQSSNQAVDVGLAEGVVA
jgi:hypothetical protein